MKYINAKTLLPNALIEELQSYIQGGYLYVPTREEQQKHRGELSGYRKELQQRNREIIEEHRKGVSIESLADAYCLSVHAIRKLSIRNNSKGLLRCCSLFLYKTLPHYSVY